MLLIYYTDFAIILFTIIRVVARLNHVLRAWQSAPSANVPQSVRSSKENGRFSSSYFNFDTSSRFARGVKSASWSRRGRFKGTGIKLTKFLRHASPGAAVAEPSTSGRVVSHKATRKFITIVIRPRYIIPRPSIAAILDPILPPQRNRSPSYESLKEGGREGRGGTHIAASPCATTTRNLANVGVS